MIRAQKLYFSYTGAAPFVLDGVDLEVRRGEYVSVVGDNGSGKTTLMRLALKMLRPSFGNIETSASRTGYVPQRAGTDAGFPITVFEMLNSYRKLLKIKDKSVIKEKLALVGMDDFHGTLTRTLSGGQQQKTLIARALIGEPDLLVLDEPSTGIDSGSQEDIYTLLRDLKNNGVTVVSVEHNLAAAVSNSSLIYHLFGGRGHICTPRQYADEFLSKKPVFKIGGADAQL